jgi:hypothetical protein
MENTAIVNQNVDYHEAHQKLGHPGHDTTRATALKLVGHLQKRRSLVSLVQLERPNKKN